MITWALVVASAVTLSSGQGNDGACLRFGGSACCPRLTPLGREIQEGFKKQPLYIKFLPKNEDTVNIDNICYTFFPVPYKDNVYLAHISAVNSDGQNQVRSFMISGPEAGVRRFGNGLCQFVDIDVINSTECNTTVAHRCLSGGDCPFEDIFDSPSGLFGYSVRRKPTTRACLSQISTGARNLGLPSDEYHILPMKLPSRCVVNRVCIIRPTIQRFCQTVGISFPNLNCEQRVF